MYVSEKTIFTFSLFSTFYSPCDCSLLIKLLIA